MSKEKILEIQNDLKKLEARGKLEVLGDVTGIPTRALLRIMRGQRPPTAHEIQLIEMMR